MGIDHLVQISKMLILILVVEQVGAKQVLRCQVKSWMEDVKTGEASVFPLRSRQLNNPGAGKSLEPCSARMVTELGGQPLPCKDGPPVMRKTFHHHALCFREPRFPVLRDSKGGCPSVEK